MALSTLSGILIRRIFQSNRLIVSWIDLRLFSSINADHRTNSFAVLQTNKASSIIFATDDEAINIILDKSIFRETGISKSTRNRPGPSTSLRTMSDFSADHERKRRFPTRLGRIEDFPVIDPRNHLHVQIKHQIESRLSTLCQF